VKLKWVALIAVGLLSCAVAGSLLLADVIPPDALTITRMEVMRTAGERLRSRGVVCPSSASALSEASSKRPEPTDGWGRPIRLTCEPGGAVTLESLGADGRRGGEGMDRDLAIRF